MATLFHFPLDPFAPARPSGACRVWHEVELEEIVPWEASPVVGDFRPRRSSVLFDGFRGRSSAAFIRLTEYLEETVAPQSVRVPCSAETPAERAEARRLAAWFDQHFYNRYSGPC